MKKFVLVLAGVLSSGAVEAKLSSDKIEKQADNIKAVISACKFDPYFARVVCSNALCVCSMCSKKYSFSRKDTWRQPDALCTQYLHLRKGLRLSRRGNMPLGYHLVFRLVCLRQGHDEGRRPGCEGRSESTG